MSGDREDMRRFRNREIRFLFHSSEAPRLETRKAVDSITFQGAPVAVPIPGASITYIIFYSNSGNGIANNSIIYDGIPSDTYYITNALLAPATGWTSQYSIELNPVQSYISPDYTDGYASKTNLRWVRWRKVNVDPGEFGSVTYKVIVK